MEVIAHRGFSGIAPENTIAAIREAIACGADRVEFDVLLTRDGAPVVIHDPDLDRTTDGRGPVAARDLPEVRRLDAGRWFQPRFTGERVPTLEEALRECRGRTAMNLEIKPEAVDPGPGEAREGIEARVVEAIRALGLEKSVAVSSFEPRALLRVGRLAPEITLWSLYEPGLHRGMGPREVCAAVRSAAFGCAVDEVSPRWIAEAHREGLRVNVYTADDPAVLRELIRLGVDGVFTNWPDRLLRELGRRGGGGPPSSSPAGEGIE